MLGFVFSERNPEMSRFPSGPRLRAVRTAAGLSVEQVAIHAGKSAHTIQGYELGRIEPPIHVLAQIAAYCGAPLSSILGESMAVSA